MGAAEGQKYKVPGWSVIFACGAGTDQDLSLTRSTSRNKQLSACRNRLRSSARELTPLPLSERRKRAAEVPNETDAPRPCVAQQAKTCRKKQTETARPFARRKKRSSPSPPAHAVGRTRAPLRGQTPAEVRKRGLRQHSTKNRVPPLR